MNKIESFSEEVKLIFEYIQNTLLMEYPNNKVLPIHFILGIFEIEECKVNKFLQKKLMQTQILNLKEQCLKILNEDKIIIQKQYDFDKIIENTNFLNEILKIKKENIDTIDILIYLLDNNSNLKIVFRGFHITPKNLHKYNEDLKKPINEKEPVLDNKKNVKIFENNEIERTFVNLHRLSSEGKIQNIVGHEKTYAQIFRTFLKKENNNVLIVGDNGVGKTNIVTNIANILLSDELISKKLNNRQIILADPIMLLNGAMFKGVYENRVKNIITEAKKLNKYIFFVDDIDFLYENNKYTEADINMFINSLINENNICFIGTLNNKGLSNISKQKKLIDKCTIINIDEPTEEETFLILKEVKTKYEKYHNILFTDEILQKIISLSKKYITEQKLPHSAINIIDEIGSYIILNEKEDEELQLLKNELKTVLEEKQKSIKEKNYELVDSITKKEIELTSLIALTEKTITMNKEPIVITLNNVYQLISDKCGVPLSDLTIDEKNKLKTLDKKLKCDVIGQDEAISEICKVIKRRRVGLSNPNKPSVFMFVGSTGTGKTLLAKKIAENIFGSEKYLVRLDMSEYSDKMAAAKLVGSSQGYVGYEDGAVLTEAIRKNKYCVLLLDECEKADDSAFNIFLQIFDDGRLTDNKGNVLNFKNTIIIMTSNIGAQEVSERNGGIGFNNTENKNNFEKSIYEKSIKKRFKPEFINRIDKVIFFNRLTNENIKQIIHKEVENVNKKLLSIGYSLHSNVYEPLTNTIFTNVKDKLNYGARPIIRETEKIVTDKLTDMIINKTYRRGHKFNIKEILT